MRVIAGYAPIYVDVPELDVFEANKERLAEQWPGKYVYLVGDQITGPFNSEWDALCSEHQLHEYKGYAFRIPLIGQPGEPSEGSIHGVRHEPELGRKAEDIPAEGATPRGVGDPQSALPDETPRAGG